MKKLLFMAILFIFFSCQKEQPQIKCGIITDKYSGNGQYIFEIGDNAMGLGERLQVSESVYNSHKVTDRYCY